MRRWWLFVILAGALMVLAGCAKAPVLPEAGEQLAPAPTASNVPAPAVSQSPLPVSTPLEEEDSSMIVARVLEAAAKAFDVPQEKIEVVSVETVDWPSACLGCAEADDICAQVITPGYRVVLRMGDARREAHTDATGRTIRFCEGSAGANTGPAGQQRPVPDEVWSRFTALLDYWMREKRGYGLEQVQKWEGLDITPPGLLGAVTYLFSGDRWNVTFVCPAVAADPICRVTLSHAAMGTIWEGRVNGAGEVVEDETPESIIRETPCDKQVTLDQYATWAGVEITPLEGGFRFVHHLPYVCCAELVFSAGGTAEEGVIRIVETNVGEMCRCMCPYNVAGEVDGLPSGSYTVEFWGVQFLPLYEPELITSTTVTVP